MTKLKAICLASTFITIMIAAVAAGCNSINKNQDMRNTPLDTLAGAKLGMPVSLPAFDVQKHVTDVPDYSKDDSWVTMPSWFCEEKQAVDVFWVYPTILSDSTSYLMDIHDSNLRKKAEWTLVEQASIFNGQANIYAPYYRQNNVNINPLMLTTAKPIFELGQQDLVDAFSYFLEHYNRGERPIILAGHSQGSVRIVELCKAGKLLADSPEQMSRLVAAYTIGYSITPQDIEINPLIKIGEQATETGCFIAYNTLSDLPGVEHLAPTVLAGTFVVNPLSWKTDTIPIAATENIEAVFFRHDDPLNPARYPHFAAAQKRGNALVVTDIKNPKELPVTSNTFPQGVYHIYDYAIFYGNLKENVADRINAYQNKNLR